MKNSIMFRRHKYLNCGEWVRVFDVKFLSENYLSEKSSSRRRSIDESNKSDQPNKNSQYPSINNITGSTLLHYRSDGICVESPCIFDVELLLENLLRKSSARRRSIDESNKSFICYCASSFFPHVDQSSKNNQHFSINSISGSTLLHQQRALLSPT
jgi:hypothetical protein